MNCRRSSNAKSNVLLQILQVHGGGLRGVPRQVAPFLVEEHLHVLETVLLPQEILVLHPVLPVLLLRAGVELRRISAAQGQDATDQGSEERRSGTG